MKAKKKEGRKSRRKNERREKKARIHNYHLSKGKNAKGGKEESSMSKKGAVAKKNRSNKVEEKTKVAKSLKMPDSFPDSEETVFQKKTKPKTLSLQDELMREFRKTNNMKNQLEKNMFQTRVKKLNEDNAIEEKEIKQMETALGLKKASKSKIANDFSDGLDYILEVCERKKLKKSSKTEKKFQNDESTNFADDFTLATGKAAASSEERVLDNESDSDDAPEELSSTRASYKSGKNVKKINEAENKKESNEMSDDLPSTDDEENEYLSDFVESELDNGPDEREENSNMKRKREEESLSGSESTEVEMVESKSKNASTKKSKKKKNVTVFDDGDVKISKKNSNKMKEDEIAKTEKKITIKSKKSKKILDENSKEEHLTKKKIAKFGQKNLSVGDDYEGGDKISQSSSDSDLDGAVDVGRKQKGSESLKKTLEKQSTKKVQKKKIDNSKMKDKSEEQNMSTDEDCAQDSSESDLDDTMGMMNESVVHDCKTGESVVENTEKNGVWEDIYGRMRDKDGNVMETAAYVPPHLRKLSELPEKTSDTNKKLEILRKQMKGLLNRLAENNMVKIASQVENFYMSHSRNEMNETLWNLLCESLIMETATPERLVAEHAMLVAVLSANIGGEVSAHCLQRVVTMWHQLWIEGPSVGDKRTNNLLLLLSFMFHFNLFHCILLYDILELLLKNVDEKSVELLLGVFRTVGFSLRKDDPVRLKDYVLKVQGLASDTASQDGTRVRFLLDTILAIKNNNMSKISNYDPEYAERIKKTMKACIRKGNYNAELKVTLDDLLKADERGRWWVVGSAWTGELPGEKEPNEVPHDREKLSTTSFSSNLLELAKKQRMNTDARRAVFCVIMSSEDYLDAFTKLLKLGMKGPSEREIMNVLIHCLLQEKTYNPYYAHLAKRFSTFNRRFQVMLQFALWDKIQNLSSLASFQIPNLAKFLGLLILEKALPLSVLKVVQFAELDKPGLHLIRQVLITILLGPSDNAVIAVFSRVAVSQQLKLFRESLRLFLNHFVLKNSKAIGGTDMTLLTARVKIAETALFSSQRRMPL